MMVYFVGVLTKVTRNGVVVNAGEATKCNIFVAITDDTKFRDRLEVGRLAKIMAIPRWRKTEGDDGDHFSLSFTALEITLK